jgi:hypothetical protein
VGSSTGAVSFPFESALTIAVTVAKILSVVRGVAKRLDGNNGAAKSVDINGNDSVLPTTATQGDSRGNSSQIDVFGGPALWQTAVGNNWRCTRSLANGESSIQPPNTAKAFALRFRTKHNGGVIALPLIVTEGKIFFTAAPGLDEILHGEKV